MFADQVSRDVASLRRRDVSGSIDWHRSQPHADAGIEPGLSAIASALPTSCTLAARRLQPSGPLGWTELQNTARRLIRPGAFWLPARDRSRRRQKRCCRDRHDLGARAGEVGLKEREGSVPGRGSRVGPVAESRAPEKPVPKAGDDLKLEVRITAAGQFRIPTCVLHPHGLVLRSPEREDRAVQVVD
jgi:hypothetical protein